MTTNTPIIYIKDNGQAVFARYIHRVFSGHVVRWEDRGEGYRATGISDDNIFLMTHDGLNLAFERSAHLQLQEAIENNETELLPTEVAYIAQALKSATNE